MWVRLLRDCRRAQKNSNDNADVADQTKTAARHDSLPRLAGAPLIFYNRVRVLARHKVVIGLRQSSATMGNIDAGCATPNRLRTLTKTDTETVQLCFEV